MKNLDRIYNRSFFEEWGNQHQEYIESAKLITEILISEAHPKRIIDLGCGCGLYTHFLKQKGIDVIAIDGVLPPQDLKFPIEIEKYDLTKPIQNIWSPFDMTLCFEVAEHIPESQINPFIDNILQFSDLLVLSAAPPGQGGHHHVNEQPKRYWVKKLAEKSFAYNRKRTGRFLERFKKTDCPYKWMGEHISFYERVKTSDELRRDFPFSTRMKSIR